MKTYAALVKELTLTHGYNPYEQVKTQQGFIVDWNKESKSDLTAQLRYHSLKELTYHDLQFLVRNFTNYDTNDYFVQGVYAEIISRTSVKSDYPVTIYFPQGAIATVDSEEELKTLRADLSQFPEYKFLVAYQQISTNYRMNLDIMDDRYLLNVFFTRMYTAMISMDANEIAKYIKVNDLRQNNVFVDAFAMMLGIK